MFFSTQQRNSTRRRIQASTQNSRVILLIFLLWAVWLSAEYGVFGPNSYVRLHNNGDSNLPSLIGLRGSLRHGQLGYWAPQWACGTDRGAEAGTSDIRVIPFFVLPGWMAYALFTLMQRFVAGYFAFWLIREELELSFWPAMYAALGYALFAQEWWYRDWAGFTLFDGLIVPGLPFTLWALSRIHSGQGWRSAFWAVLAGVFAATTGSLAVSMFLFPLVLFWFALLSPRRNLQFWSFVGLFAGVWGLLAMPLILPSILAARSSNRATFAPEMIWGFSAHLLTVVRAIHGNLLALIFATAGLLVSRSRRLLGLLAVIAFCCSVEMFYFLLAKILRHSCPLLSGFSLERLMVLVPFLAFTAAALGIDRLAARWKFAPKWLPAQRFHFSTDSALAVSAAFLLLWHSGKVKLRTLHDLANQENYAALYQNPDLEQLARQNSSVPPFRVVTIAVGDVLPLYPPGAVWAYGMEAADGFLVMQSQRYQGFWEQVIAPLFDVEADRYNYVHFWGAQLYLFAPTDRASPSTALEFDKYYRLNLLSLANVRYVISPIPLSEAQLYLLPSSYRDTQIKWTLQGKLRRLATILRGCNPGIPLYIYENRDALPRFFLAGIVRSLDSPTQMDDMMSHADLHELRSSAFLDPSDAQPLIGRLRGGTGTVTVLRYHADEIELETAATSNTILIATNTFSPFWKASVDGQRVPLMPVDHTFQGVFLEAGSHFVTLTYEPPYALP